MFANINFSGNGGRDYGLYGELTKNTLRIHRKGDDGDFFISIKNKKLAHLVIFNKNFKKFEKELRFQLLYKRKMTKLEFDVLSYQLSYFITSIKTGSYNRYLDNADLLRTNLRKLF